MKGYWITLCQVTDSETYGEYIKLAGPAIQKYGGKFLARGGEQVKYEGSSYDRTVVVEFDSLQSAKDAYNSEEYKPIKKIRLDNAISNGIIIKGE